MIDIKDAIKSLVRKEINLEQFKLNDDIYYKFEKYISCIINWAKSHNIVSSKFSRKEIIENILDSIAGASFLSFSSPVYDAGSGGGFPGVAIALIAPEISFVLVESDRKKCSFLRLIKAQLSIKNITIENERIEKLNNLNFLVTKAAFSPQNISIVTQSLKAGGEIAIWATQKNRQNFIEALNEAGLKMKNEYAYELPDAPGRLILLFKKE